MSERPFRIAAAISDIHIGIKAVPANVLKRQLKEHFIRVLKDLQYLDAIFVLGDVLHTIVSLNSENSEVFNWFIDQLYKLAKKRGCTVVIIKGTLSHDNDQLNNIKHYQNNDDGVDFRVYESIEVINIWDDYKVLVLPDVKVKKNKDIDKYLIEDEYDLILGHGTIDLMQFVTQESEAQPTKSYIYDVKKLTNASKGPVLFGHIHQYQSYKTKFYYVGPFTLLERGGVNSGFAIMGISTDDRTKFKVEQYENPDSASYFEFNVTKLILDKYEADDIIYSVDKALEGSKPHDLVTLRITRGDELSSADKVAILESRYRSDRRFSIVKKIKTKREEQSEAINAERKEKFAYTMDNSLEVADIMFRYYLEETKPTLTGKHEFVSTITAEDFCRILGYTPERNNKENG